jgi:hypothetical protein
VITFCSFTHRKNLMSTSVLAVVVLLPTALVVVALFAVLWRERTSTREAFVAIASGVLLAAWAIITTILARRGSFQPGPGAKVPPIGVAIVAALLGSAFFVSVSPSLRHLLRNQANLIRLHLWRLEGIVFLILMVQGQMPALWALPAGVGDVLVGATALWVASGLERPGGRRRAIAFTLLGMADLIVAITLGVMVNPGPTQVFHTVPTGELLVQYPLALVPTFLVPLAFTLHIISLLQLRGMWGRRGP